MDACRRAAAETTSIVTGVMRVGGEVIGRFSRYGDAGHHCWSWREAPWPFVRFTLGFDALAPPARPDESDVYPIPPTHRRRLRAVGATSERLYTIESQGVRVATLGVENGALHWLEVGPDVLEVLGTGRLTFVPSTGAELARISSSRTQRPISLAASCGHWPSAP